MSKSEAAATADPDGSPDASILIRPGPTAIGSLVGTCALAITAFWIPWTIWLVAVVLLAVLALSMADFRQVREDSQKVDVELSLPTTSPRDGPFDATLTVNANVGRRTRLATRVQIPLDLAAIDVPSASQRSINAEPTSWYEDHTAGVGDGPIECVRTFKIANRGAYQFGPLWVRSAGRFGMLEGQRRHDIKASVDVLPETFWAAQQLAVDDASEQQLLDRIAKTRDRGTGTEFESLSEFRYGDDPQRIDWRASARNQHLIIRRYRIERHRDVMIVVDSGRLMASETSHGSKLDCAVDAALMLGRVALRAGDRCGLATYDDQVRRFIPPLTGGQAMSTLVQNAYDLRTNYRESDFGAMFETLQARQRKRSLVVVLSDVADEATTTRYRSALIALAKRHVVLFAAIRTPLLSDLPRRSVDTLLAASRQVVAFRLQQDRERAIRSLQRSPVHVLDVEPSELTVPLINQFVESRVQNRL